MFEFGPFRLDVGERRLLRAGQPIPLQPKVFDTLLYLLRRRGRLVRRNEILDSVWADTYVTGNALSRCIKEIRQALGDDAHRPQFLETVARSGYRFIANITDRESSTIRSIAVLPFKPLSANAGDEALELGMAETLIMRLSGLGAIAVRPLSAVRCYGDPHRDPIAAGREQGVEAVLDGSLQRLGDKLRVSIRLINVRDGMALWADQFDQPFTDVFTVQDSISERVVRELEVNLTERETGRMRKRHTVSTDAYRAYLIGRLHWGRYTPQSAAKSIEYFKKATETDPHYALAYAGWAEACLSLASVGLDASDHYREAKALATRALQIDDGLAEAYAVLATSAWEHDWDSAGAAELFSKAIALKPNDAQVRFAHANFCGYAGRAGEAIAEANAALMIDPLSPMNNTLLAAELYLARRWNEAADQARKTIEIAPSFAFGHFFLGLTSLQVGKSDEAVDHLEKARSLSERPDVAAALGYTYAVAGREADARRVFAALEGPPLALALVTTGLGEFDKAFGFLNQIFEDRSWHIYLLSVDPLFDRLRSDPRTDKLLRRAGLRD